MFSLKKIKLTNFRCYSNYEQEFSPKINIIIGNNATGKTSLVEAIYALGITKSPKATNDSEMINHEEEFCTIKGWFLDEKEHEVVYSVANKRKQLAKQIVKDNKKVNHMSEYLGFYYVVMFSPEDIELINGAPLVKRRFLDTNIGQIDPVYLNSLTKYKKILKERNQLLKDIALNGSLNQDLLDVYSNELVKEAKIIIKKRKEFVQKINVFFKEQVKAISYGKETAELEYLPLCSEEEIEVSFKESRKLDMITKTTNVGPHRDDLGVIFNGYEAVYASQGQQKTFALALKLALIDILRQESERIIVILDDVFGELDINRQKEIIKLLEMDYQIFITTTSIEHLDSSVLKGSNIIKIMEKGE